MNKKIRLGSVTILFAVMIIALALLALISEETARSDYSVAERYSVELKERNNLLNVGEEKMAEIDLILADCKSLNDITLPDWAEIDETNTDEINIHLSDEDRVLEIKLKVDISDNISYDIISYRLLGKWSEEDSLTLWH